MKADIVADLQDFSVPARGRMALSCDPTGSPRSNSSTASTFPPIRHRVTVLFCDGMSVTPNAAVATPSIVSVREMGESHAGNRSFGNHCVHNRPYKFQPRRRVG